MKLTVPFVYEAMIIKPRCRKPSFQCVNDCVEVDIKEIAPSSLPKAFKSSDQEYYWDGYKLWSPLMTDDNKQAKAEQFRVIIEKNVAAGGAAAIINPFKGYWKSVDDDMMMRYDCNMSSNFVNIDDEEVLSKQDINYREWVDDNKQAVEARAHEIAENYLICDGIVYRPASEPYYAVTTFGMGGNHGFTGLYLENNAHRLKDKENIFSILDYQAACIYADKVAKERGDTDSMPVQCDASKSIEVFIPEALSLYKPQIKTNFMLL